MKNLIKLCTCLAVCFSLTVSCSDKNSTQAKNIDSVETPKVEVEVFVSGGPDLKHFDMAMEAFDKKEFEKSANYLRDAADVLWPDSTEDNNIEHIEKAIEAIQDLADDVEAEIIDSKLDFVQRFSAAELMISHHYLSITEEIDYEYLSEWEVKGLNNALAYLKAGLIHGSYYEKEAGLDLIQETRSLLGKVENGEGVDITLVRNQMRRIKNFVAEL